MTATASRSRTTPGHDTTAPRHKRAGMFLLRVLEQLGSTPSVWDPWLVLTPYRAMRRTVDRR